MSEVAAFGFHASVTLANPIDLTRKRAAPDVEVTIYADRIKFQSPGLDRVLFPAQELSRDQVAEIYPVSIRTPIFKLHPMVRGRNQIKILAKSRGRYDGRDQYLIIFDSPSTGDVLNSFEAAGYPVDREVRLSSVLSGDDWKAPG